MYRIRYFYNCNSNALNTYKLAFVNKKMIFCNKIAKSLTEGLNTQGLE